MDEIAERGESGRREDAAKFAKKDFYWAAAMLLFYRHHPVRAVEDIFGIRLAPHQRIALRLIWNGGSGNVILLFSRAMGKTFLCALAGLLYALLHYAMSIIFLGGDGFRQGKLILEEAAKIINEELNQQKPRKFVRRALDRSSGKSPILKEPDVWSIPWRNRSRIRSAPIGDGNRIRGFRSQVNFIDERKDMSKDVKEKVVKPFGALGKDVVSEEQSFKNMNIDAGTLEFQEDDYTKDVENYFRLMEEGNPDYLVISFEYLDAFREDPEGRFHSAVTGKYYSYWRTPYAIRLKEIEDAIENGEMDEDSWNAEYRCRPKRAVGNVFTYQDVKAIRDYELMSEAEEGQILEARGLYHQAVNLRFLRPQTRCEDPVVIGVDVARESANTAFVALRLGPLAKKEWDPVTQTGKSSFCNVINACQRKNMPYREAAQFIYDWLDCYPNCLLVAMDMRGGGSGVRDDLYAIALNWQKEGIERQPLFDPDDDEPGGIAPKISRGMGDPRLALLTYTDEDNTVALTRVKGAVEKRKLLLTRSARDVNEDVNTAYQFINEIATEMRVIQTKPTTNWLKIVVGEDKSASEQVKRQRTKDLWTALMYSYGEGYKRFLAAEKAAKKILNEVGMVPMGGGGGIQI